MNWDLRKQELGHLKNMAKVLTGTDQSVGQDLEGTMTSDDEYLLIAATRYTLGRQSYVVGIMCDILKARAAEMSDNARYVIAKDIRDQRKHGYGADVDEAAWAEALRAVNVEVGRQEK